MPQLSLKSSLKWTIVSPCLKHLAEARGDLRQRPLVVHLALAAARRVVSPGCQIRHMEARD
jgi:hypothetical protein